MRERKKRELVSYPYSLLKHVLKFNQNIIANQRNNLPRVKVLNHQTLKIALDQSSLSDI